MPTLWEDNLLTEDPLGLGYLLEIMFVKALHI